MMRLLVGLSLVTMSSALPAAELEARLEWLSRVELGTPVAGRVDNVLVAEGQALARGELLLALDPRPFQIERDQRRAELERFDARFGESQREWQRAQELFDRTLISDHDLELAQVAFAVAEAERAVLRAALAQAELALEYSRLKAPFDAWLLSRQVEPGELVVNGERAQALLSIVPRGRMAAVAQLKAGQLGRLAVGDSLALRYEGRRYEGRIASLALSPDEAGRHRLAVAFEVDEGARPGAAVTLLLP